MRFSAPDTAMGVEVQDLIIACWTGCADGTARQHIAEPDDIGDILPGEVPPVHRVSADLPARADVTSWQGLGPDQTGSVPETRSARRTPT